MSKHTSGPWQKCGGWTPGFVAICDSDNRYIVYGMATPESCCNEHKSRCIEDVEEQQANARLIASAPELLAACQMLKQWFDYGGDAPEMLNFCVDVAVIAIRKAEGEG